MAAKPIAGKSAAAKMAAGSKAEPRPSGPLAGLRVVEVGMLFAGPMVSAFLSDLGAEVIKVEHPDGDEVRKIGRFKDGEGLWWRVANRNKTLLSADLSKPEGAEIVRKLSATADVFIENFRPGRLAAWGLDYDTLSVANPGLVMLHFSGYGLTGPYRRKPGMGTLAEAFSGFAHVTGEADGPPALPAFPLADGVAALTGTYAVMAALWQRDRNGGIGDNVELSLYEPLLPLLGAMLLDYDQLGYVAMRKGNRSNWSVPRNAYRTRDQRWVAVSSAANSAARRLFRAIGRADMADDPSLATNPLRLKRIDECDQVIADWIGAHTLEDVLACFEQNDVIAGPIFDVAQLFSDPHVQARETLVELDDPVLGKVKMQNVVPRFSRNPGKVRFPGKPGIGADTRQILAGLGYGEADIERMIESGVVKATGE